MKRTNLRIGCLLLVLVLLLSVLPVTALAVENFPVYLLVYTNDNRETAVINEKVGEYAEGTALNEIIENLDVSDYYTSRFGFTVEDIYVDGWYNDLDHRTVSGYTNLHCMVYENEKIVYFKTLDDLTAYQSGQQDDSLIFKSDVKQYGTQLPTITDIPTREGYKFLYWAREGTETDVSGQTLTGWTNLYGVWEELPPNPEYTVTFVSDGQQFASITKEAGTTISAPNTPSKPNYTFIGWVDKEGNPVSFPYTVSSDVTLYAKWEENEPVPELSFYVTNNFPYRQEVGTYRDVKLTIFSDKGLGWQYGAKLQVTVKGPKGSDAKLWYDKGSDYGWWRYVDVIDNSSIFSNLEFNETGMSIPLSMYLDVSGDYTFTFTLKDKNGAILATDTASVYATYPAHDDYRIYLDSGKHGSISTRPSTWADYKDTVTVYVTPDKGYELDTLKVYDARGNRVSLYTDYHGNYYFTMPNREVTVYATFKEVNYGHFTDVPKDSWYYDAVYYVYSHDIMDGIGNRTFNPYGDLSRAMIVTTLYRLEGEPVVRTSGSFRDVPANTWYSDAVEWAAKEGIVKGYGKKTFGPGNSVTVEQLAAILQRYADYKGYDVSDVVWLYADAVVSDWAVNNVRWAAAEGLLRDGRSTNATKVATRAEIAYALYGFMVNVAK